MTCSGSIAVSIRRFRPTIRRASRPRTATHERAGGGTCATRMRPKAAALRGAPLARARAMLLRVSCTRYRTAFLCALEAAASLGCSTSQTTRGESLSACAGGQSWPSTDGSSSGYEQCQSGLVHRVTQVACPGVMSPGMADSGASRAVLGELSFGTCTTDVECTAMPFGFCKVIERSAPQPTTRTCAYSCASDADCAAGSICVCGDRVGECVPATCTRDADCGGGPCYLEYTFVSCGQPAGAHFTCASQTAACATDSQCGGTDICILGACQPRMNTCGRPFVVEGAARTATVVPRLDWQAALCVDLSNLDASSRYAAAEHWAEMGRMEHASIASFARFTLQLLSLGAPAELLSAAQRALGDEVEHARLCFGLASRYLGEAVGPGALRVDDALCESDERSVLRDTFFEACLEETCSAIEAAESAELATDPAVSAALDRIADDEARHAELGWKTVQWLLASVSDEVRAARGHELREIVAREICSLGKPPTCTSDAMLTAQGILSARVRHAVRATALREVVGPCLEGLLEGLRARGELASRATVRADV